MSGKPNILPPGEYVTRSDVFVLDPHTLKAGDGGTVIDVTEPMLQKIATNQNKRTNETGDAAPLVIGHTRDGIDEQSQPEVVGYATNWKVKRFFKTGKNALCATFHIFKRSVEKVKKFPRRSVELWVENLTIDPISLLGATTPQRDLGLLKLSKGEGSKIVASMDDSGELTVDENTQQIVDAVLEAIKSTDVWQFMEQKMNQEGSEAEQAGGAGDEGLMGEPEGLPPGGGEFDPSGEQGVMDALGGGMDAGGVPGGDEDALKMAAGSPGGGNTFAPGMMGDDSQGPKKYSKISFQRMARENDQMKQTLNGLVLRYRRAEREKDLMALEHEGYMLDREEELSLCETLDDKSFTAHLQRVRLRYQKAPVGQLPYLEHSAQVNRGRSPSDVSSVVNTALKLGISYEEALNRSSSAPRSTY